VVFGLLILGRAFTIGVLDRDYWLAKKQHQTIRLNTIEAIRGNVFSSDGRLIATSVPLYDVYMDMRVENLKKIFPKGVDSLALMMAQTFGEKSGKTKSEYKQALRRAYNSKSPYFLLAKDVSHPDFKKMRTFPILRFGRYKAGFLYETRSRREMPFRDLALRTLGRYEGDSNSIGIEGAFNEYLKGITGRQLEQKISGGTWIPLNDGAEIEPKEGNDIVSTIDIGIQDVAEAELKRQLKMHKAENGCVVLMEVETGYIRAIANLGRVADSSYVENYNYAIGAGSEPGSTFKLASLMALFEDNLASPSDKFNTNGGAVRYNNLVMKDSHDGGFGIIPLNRAFEVSSNTAISLAVTKAYRSNPKKFIERIRKFHLSEPLGLQISGESNPIIKDPASKTWSGTTLPWMSIGYECRLAPIQVLAFYNAVANNGKFMKPQFVEEIRYRGQTVRRFDPVVIDPAICSKETINKLKPMLEGVVERGTAVNLKNPYYKIAGKTGTAQIASTNTGYGEKGAKKYQASFVGYFPADNPKYTCMVVVNAPSNSVYYANLVAGPIFKEVADKVYAQNIDIQESHPTLLTLNPGKQIISGYGKDLAEVMKKTGLRGDEPDDNEWVEMSVSGNKVSSVSKSMAANQVPDVRGMGLKDAMFLLENKGFRVQVKGRGVVRTQSIPAGVPARKHMVILLELA
jgi:cell division protein FtsI (penicillin-binding protein 3)